MMYTESQIGRTTRCYWIYIMMTWPLLYAKEVSPVHRTRLKNVKLGNADQMWNKILLLHCRLLAWKKFSETYFKVLFSCNTRMWPGRHFSQPKPSTAQLAATSPTSWRLSTFICSVQTDMKSIQDNITSHASASVRLSFGTMVLSATAHGRS